MAAYLERDRLGVKETTTKTTVPNDPVAKLMYYFNCVCTCIDDSNDNTFQRLKCYQSNYNSLSDEEEAMLLILCLALSPDKLINSVFFLNNDMGGTTRNRFFELSAVSTRLLVAQSLLIAGQQRRVRKIMMFKESWIEDNYIKPLKAFVERSKQGRRALPRPQQAPIASYRQQAPGYRQQVPSYTPRQQYTSSYNSTPNQSIYKSAPTPTPQYNYAPPRPAPTYSYTPAQQSNPQNTSYSSTPTTTFNYTPPTSTPTTGYTPQSSSNVPRRAAYQAPQPVVSRTPAPQPVKRAVNREAKKKKSCAIM